ncbi:MAG: ATP-binding protein [Deltaproteobacteria bacterium]|nr:ATP-binding protein [Deltaproteobacteria bacterium]
MIEPPSRSFFLFGARATGKSTWLRRHFAAAQSFDLLDSRLRFELLRDPGRFRALVLAEPRKRWIVVDEVQQVPGLLNDVHALIEAGGYRFAMSGSSARRLKGGQANLLGGRALLRTMFPLTFEEVGDSHLLSGMVEHGALPLVVTAEDSATRADILEAYALTYLEQEIQAEAAVRNLASFSRFLEVAALANAQVTNLSALARDAGVQRPTVQGYFQILKDTLVGHELPAWRPRARVKETRHPKFYWFDAGVARAMSRRTRLPVDPEERGRLLETYVFHELRAHNDYRKLGGDLSYWSTPGATEVDFVWSRGDDHVAIEVKASARWRPEFSKGLDALRDKVKLRRALVVYLGDQTLAHDQVRVLPLARFLDELYAGKVLPRP